MRIQCGEARKREITLICFSGNIFGGLQRSFVLRIKLSDTRSLTLRLRSQIIEIQKVNIQFVNVTNITVKCESNELLPPNLICAVKSLACAECWIGQQTRGKPTLGYLDDFNEERRYVGWQFHIICKNSVNEARILSCLERVDEIQVFF